MKGKLKFFDSGKGFGFIDSDCGAEYYFHASQCENKERVSWAHPGDPLEFDVVRRRNQTQAANVKLLPCVA